MVDGCKDAPDDSPVVIIGAKLGLSLGLFEDFGVNTLLGSSDGIEEGNSLGFFEEFELGLIDGKLLVEVFGS